MHALLILNGHSDFPDSVLQRLMQFDVIVATDGAVHDLPDTVRPHIICGDFDSADPGLCKERFPHSDVIVLPDQSSSDLEKALALILEHRSRRVTIVKALGGRVDHMLSVVSALVTHHSTAHIVVTDRDSTFEVISPSAFDGATRTIECQPGDLISLLPLSPHATVSIRGVQWPLSHAVLSAGTSGVSNRATETTVCVTVSEGLVCFCHLAEHWGAARRP